VPPDDDAQQEQTRGRAVVPGDRSARFMAQGKRRPTSAESSNPASNLSAAFALQVCSCHQGRVSRSPLRQRRQRSARLPPHIRRLGSQGGAHDRPRRVTKDRAPEVRHQQRTRQSRRLPVGRETGQRRGDRRGDCSTPRSRDTCPSGQHRPHGGPALKLRRTPACKKSRGAEACGRTQRSAWGLLLVEDSSSLKKRASSRRWPSLRCPNAWAMLIVHVGAEVTRGLVPFGGLWISRTAFRLRRRDDISRPQQRARALEPTP